MCYNINGGRKKENLEGMIKMRARLESLDDYNERMKDDLTEMPQWYMNVKFWSDQVLRKYSIPQALKTDYFDHVIFTVIERVNNNRLSYEQLTDENDFRLNWQIIKNIILDKIRYENRRCHDDIASEEFHASKFNQSNTRTDRNVIVDEIINKFTGVEYDYLVLKGYFAGVDVSKYLNGKLSKIIYDIEDGKQLNNKVENRILDSLGLGYAGNTKARKFRWNLRAKLESYGYSVMQ